MKAITTLTILVISILAFSQLSADGHKDKKDGMRMTHVMITHEVDDAEHWLARTAVTSCSRTMAPNTCTRSRTPTTPT